MLFYFVKVVVIIIVIHIITIMYCMGMEIDTIAICLF